jgi:hypothetical protein
MALTLSWTHIESGLEPCPRCPWLPEVSVTSCHRGWKLSLKGAAEALPCIFSTLKKNNTFPFAFLKLVYSYSPLEITFNFILKKMCQSSFQDRADY